MYNHGMKKQTALIEFGEKLRKARREKGLTQSQLADITGLSRRSIVHYERHAKMPPLEKVKKMARALRVSSDELLGMTTPTKEENQQEKASYRIMKRVRQIEKLSKRDQDMILNLINTLVGNTKLKGKL